MFPRGFLGTRSDVLMDVVLLAVLAAPLLMLYGFYLTKRGQFTKHRNIQVVLVSILMIAVALFEIDIRASGGTRAFVSGSSLSETSFLRVFLAVHVLVAVLSVSAWLALAVASWRRFSPTRPGWFRIDHRRYGKMIFSGAVFTAISGAALYVMSFVL
jgi:putative membrane protein